MFLKWLKLPVRNLSHEQWPYFLKQTSAECKEWYHSHFCRPDIWLDSCVWSDSTCCDPTLREALRMGKAVTSQRCYGYNSASKGHRGPQGSLHHIWGTALRLTNTSRRNVFDVQTRHLFFFSVHATDAPRGWPSTRVKELDRCRWSAVWRKQFMFSIK